MIILLVDIDVEVLSHVVAVRDRYLNTFLKGCIKNDSILEGYLLFNPFIFLFYFFNPSTVVAPAVVVFVVPFLRSSVVCHFE